VSEFVPLPGRPGYRIDRRGLVASEKTGATLRVDAWGRVRLRVNKRQVRAFVGELTLLTFGQSGVCASPDAPDEALAKAEEAAAALRKELEKTNFELAGARGALENARKANLLLIGIRDDLTKENKRLQAATPKAKSGKTGKKSAPRSAPRFDDDALFPADESLDDWGDL
jgi:hypothetical protein